MNTKVKSIPDGYHAITAYLSVTGAAKAIDYYQKALGAKVRLRMDGPGGSVMHSELEIGDSLFMLADESPMSLCRSPASVGGSTVGLFVYVENVDATFKQALAAGGKEVRPLQDQFYGDRTGSFEDPFGHRWTLGTHIEDVSDEEMKRRMAAMSQK